ncbi:MAG: TonB family protein [Bacteroidia bacterium]
MKKLILAAAAVLFIGLTVFAQHDLLAHYRFTSSTPSDFNGSSQELSFAVRGRFSRPVKKENLNDAKLISDVIPGYPSNWITRYVSTEILVTSGGKSVKTIGSNAVLTSEQKKILTVADAGTNIVVDVIYKYKNTVTDDMEIQKMHTVVTVIPENEVVVPENEAEYIGGFRHLTKYLKENCINKISETIPKLFQQGIVSFAINEKGEIANVKISVTSGDPKMDKLLLDAISKMPKWKPAQNSKGVKGKQEFEFSVGIGGC